MERLTNKELRALLQFLRECYDICDLDTFAHRVISRLPKIVPSEITSYNEVNPRRKRIRVTFNPSNIDPSPDARKFFDLHMPEHPLIEHYIQTRDGRAVKISDFLSQRQFHRLGIYHDFYRCLNVEHQMSVNLPAPPPLVVAFALNRDRRDFSERDRLALNLLTPISFRHTGMLRRSLRCSRSCRWLGM